jgi:hypothetical protein
MRRGMGTNEKMHPVRLGNNNVIILRLRRVFVTKKNCVHGAEEVAGIRQAANSDFFQRQKAHTFLSLAPKKKGRFLFSQLDAANQFPVSTFEYFYGRKWASEIAGAAANRQPYLALARFVK